MMRALRSRMTLAVLSVIAFAVAGGCGRKQAATPSPTPSIQEQRAARAAEVPQPIQDRWDYLNRIRQSDAYADIDRTRVDEQNQLGVVVAANLPPDRVDSIMKKAMGALAQKFPDSNMTLDAYAPATPLRKLGTARYNSQTGQVTYTPAQ